MPKLRLKRPLDLRDVVVLSAPLLALGLYLFGAAVFDYSRMRQFDDWWSAQSSVARFGYRRVLGALAAPRAAAIAKRLDPDDPAKGALQLVVDRAEWDRIDRDVAGNWGQWIEGSILDGNDLREVRVRFRGDGSVHWTGPKKSLTVRTKKKDLHQGQRTLALSAKTPLEQYVVNALGEHVGLLAPATRLVPVYLDRVFYGLHRFVEPVDESFLRKRSRMPGNVWRGDTAERGEYFKDLPRELFRNPYIWDRVAENNRPGVPGREVLAAFLSDLNGDTLRHHERLWRRLDRDELARMLALCLVAGDPLHMSGIHNQLWYEDPSAGVLHPILWDLRLLELEDPPPNSNINRFWRAALRDPRLWARTLVWARAFLDSQVQLLAQARLLAGEAEETFADELAYERLREGVISPVGSGEGVLRVLEANAEVLRGWIDDARAGWSATPADDGSWVVDVVVSGRAPVNLEGLRLAGPQGAELACEVLREAPGSGVRAPVATAGAVTLEEGERTWRPERPLELLSGCTGSGPALEPEPIAYRLRVRAGPGLTGVRPVLGSGLGRSEPRLHQLEPGARLPAGRSWHPWLFSVPEGRDVTLAGDVRLDEDLVLGPEDSLTIEPGTRVRLGPGVSILTRGRVDAAGTGEAPIRFEAADEALPWGTLALQGERCAGSRFDFVRFAGGSCAFLEGVEYKGMVNVYNVSRVGFSACRFGDNRLCDDALNAVASRVDLTGCTFEDCNLDAADYDLSTGTIADCRFLRSGNDALDFMTAFPSVVGCTIEDSGDKGISIGEGSGPVIVDTNISGCVTGIQAKDRSRPIVLRSAVTGCQVGLDQFAKNWRYDGAGWTRLVDSVVTGNDVDYRGADGAYLTSHAARVGSVAPGSGLAPFDTLGEDATWWGRTRIDTGTPGRDAMGVLSEVSSVWGRARQEYDDEAADPTGGWRSSGGVWNLRMRRGGLRARLVDGPGRIERELGWMFEPDAGAHRLVLEVSGEGVEALDVIVGHSDGEIAVSAPLGEELAHFRYVVVPLPPGIVQSLALELHPTGHQGRFFLRGWHVWQDPGSAAE